MRLNLSKTLLIVIGVFLVASPTTTWAQRTTGTIGGTVQDETGAVIPGVDVTVTNEGTGVVSVTITGDTGGFVVPALPPGSYTVKIQMPGFRVFEQTNIVLESAQDFRRTYIMQVGEVTETVTVEGGAALVNTISSEQRVGVSQVQLAHLPMRNRNITGLLMLNPAVTVSAGPQGGHRGVRLNGMGRQSARYSMDGVEASGSPGGNLISQYGGRNRVDMLSAEAVEDVQIIKGVMPAEYSLAISGQVNIITKSGTSDFHGSAFYLWQGAGLNAHDPFLRAEGKPKPNLVFNQFGGSIGGPILPNGKGVVDSAFFFFAFEGYEERRARSVSGDVPTQLARDTALASPAFDDREKQILQVLFAPVPFPNVPGSVDAQGLAGKHRRASPETGEDRTWTLKTDANFIDGSTVSFSWNRLDPTLLLPRIALNGAGDRTWADNNNRFAASYFKPMGNWHLESRFGVQILTQDRLDKFFEVRDPTDPTEEALFFKRVPTIRIRGKNSFRTTPGELWTTNATTYNVDQKIGYNRGNHSIKFGGSYRYKAGNRNNPELPEYRFNDFQDFLDNKPFNRARITFGRPTHNGRIFQFGGFFQDDWRIASNVTLNLGFRYDFISNFTVAPRDDTAPGSTLTIVNLEPPTDWPSFNFGAALLNPKATEHDAVNLAPRAGFNWDVSGDRTFVVRGGAGVLFTNNIINTLRDGVQDLFLPRRQNFSADQVEELGIRLGTLNAQARDIVLALTTAGGTFKPATLSAYNPSMDAPYSINWTLGIQKEILEDTVWEVDYVGSHGVKFPMIRSANEPRRIDGKRPNPGLAGLSFYIDESQLTAYNGLQTRLQRRFSQGLSFGITYAYGRSLAIEGNDVGARFGSDNDECCQEFFNHKLGRGRTDGDVEHNFTSNWYWELPSPSGAAGQVIGGWALSGIIRANSGGPVNVVQSSARRRQRPDFASGFGPDNSVRLDDFADTLQFFDPEAFVLVEKNPGGVQARPGNVSRNFITGPGFWGVDFSIGKNFTFGENMRVEFRWDLLNAFNHFNTGGPRSNFSRSRFGAIEGGRGNQRISQLNLKFLF